MATQKKKTTKRRTTAKKVTKRKVTKRKKAPARKKAKKKKSSKRVATVNPGKLVNRIAIVVDRSGSMWSLKKKTIAVFNQQLKTIQAASKKSAQKTYVSVYTFGSRVDKPKAKNKRADLVKKWTQNDFRPSGATALLDGTATAIADLKKVKKTKGDESFLIIVITDGHENTSRRSAASVKKTINSIQKTGRWSVVFLTPKSGMSAVKRLGIPAGNIQSWSATTKGADKMAKNVAKGIDNFYKARAAGTRATAGFFTTSMKNVNAKNISAKLKDLSKSFHKWSVKRAAAIRPFVEKQSGAGGAYKSGNGYYELTKSETVQARKDLLIMDKKGKIFGGDAARAMLGLPVGEKIRVKPGDHGDYRIFVMSTSVNRKLVAGTTLLYKK